MSQHRKVEELFKAFPYAGLYAELRSKTPANVAETVAQYVKETRPVPLQLAVDVGCGTGQNTRPFAHYFQKVIGTDRSESMVLEARKAPSTLSNVSYEVSTAEDLNLLADSSVDLVTGALCFHWFDLKKFYAEVTRVLAPGGVLANVMHKPVRICDPDDADKSAQLDHLVCTVLWQTIESMAHIMKREATLVETNYEGMYFPFEDVVREQCAPVIDALTLDAYMTTLMNVPVYNVYSTEKPEEAAATFQKLQDDILDVCCAGMEARLRPEEVTVHIRRDYYCLMGRVKKT